VTPEIDGVEACGRIRSDLRYAECPIIMVASLDDVESLSNAFVAGASDYVTKPVHRAERIVRAALKLKAELDRRGAREHQLLTFFSNWGDRRAASWINEATGLFAGEAAEAYLTAGIANQRDDVISVLAFALDRLDAYRSAHGDEAAQGVLAQAAKAVRELGATVGVVAAAYRNGVTVLVAPGANAEAAQRLGESLRAAVPKLRLPNFQSIVSDHFTASVAAIIGPRGREIDRVHLLRRAISAVRDVAATGGNRVFVLSVERAETAQNPAFPPYLSQ
jgi:PleD family two-component response regulator